MRFICLICCLAWVPARLHAGQNLGDAVFSRLSAEEAAEWIKKAESPAAWREYTSSALASRRLDLIKVCFEQPGTRYELRDEAGKISDQDQAFKDRIVLMMLRSESTYWPYEGMRAMMNPAMRHLMVEPFVTTIKTHLPKLPLTEELLSTRAARLTLAAQLEETMNERTFAGEIGRAHV